MPLVIHGDRATDPQRVKGPPVQSKHGVALGIKGAWNCALFTLALGMPQV